MTSKEQIIQELETLSEQLIDEVFDYINLIKNRHVSQLKEPLKLKPSFDNEWWDNLSQFTSDFLSDRQQPELPDREDIFP